MRAPAVAFGTGGSGTRAVAAIMREAGVYIGPRLNNALDALALRPFVRPAIERYLQASDWIEAMWDGRGEAAVGPPERSLLDGLEEAVRLQREGIPALDAPWGWKAPRAIYLLPLIAHQFPEVLTIQLVRDGRDMAYSRNQQQAEAYRARLAPEHEGAPAPVASAAVWARVNVAAARYGQAVLGERHLVLRYEDLCGDPDAAAGRLLQHLGVAETGELRARAAAQVEPSSGGGRWLERDPAERAAVEVAAEAGLREFGYVES